MTAGSGGRDPSGGGASATAARDLEGETKRAATLRPGDGAGVFAGASEPLAARLLLPLLVLFLLDRDRQGAVRLPCRLLDERFAHEAQQARGTLQEGQDLAAAAIVATEPLLAHAIRADSIERIEREGGSGNGRRGERRRNPLRANLTPKMEPVCQVDESAKLRTAS